MTDCKCDLGNILDEETFNLRVIRELCAVDKPIRGYQFIRMVDKTDDGDVQFLRTPVGDYLLDGETPYTPIGEVSVYKRSSEPEPEPIIDDGIFRFTTNVPTGGVSFGAFSRWPTPNVTDYIVDWGDGTSTTGSATTHTYDEPGIYQISIRAGLSGNFPPVNFRGIQSVISVDSVLPYINTLYYSEMFLGSSISKVCRGLFKNNSQFTECMGTFQNCPNIRSVPDDICSYLVNVEWMDGFFRGSAIESLPAGLLDNCTQVNRIDNFCNGCANLKTVPEYLFRYNMKLLSMSSIFQDCVNLKLNRNIFCDEDTEKGTRFAWTNNWFYFTNAFNRTSYTNTEQGTAPALWEYTIARAQKGNCFLGAGNNATSLSNYNLIPSAWGGPA